MIKFFLIFKSDNIGEIEVSEPHGFSNTDFQLKQEDKRYALDVSFSGGENEFLFNNFNHEEALNNLLYYRNKFGSEAIVSVKIVFEVGYTVLGDIHFESSETDGYTYFKCKVVQDSNQSRLKSNYEIKVDILSNKDVNGKDITPITSENLLVQAKPIYQVSSWENDGNYNENHSSIGGNQTMRYMFNPAIKLKEYGVEDSFTFLEVTDIITPDEIGSRTILDSFKILKAKQNINKLKLETGDFKITINTDADNGGDGRVTGGLIVRWGETEQTAQALNLISWNLGKYENFTHSGKLTFELPKLKRGDSVWFGFYNEVRQTGGGNVAIPRLEAFTNITNFSFKLSGESVAYNTVIPSYRLYDVIQQNVKSIAGLQVIAPEMIAGGHLYNQRLINGNCLRGITTRPFYITFKDIQEGLNEFNADYKLQVDNNVFIGLYRDFYPNKEVAFLETVQFDSLNLKFNPRYVINQFTYKWKGYQSQKESTFENTFDVVHGESQWFRPNSLASNKKEVEIGWVRDAFEIEFNRIKGFQEKPSTATQDDDKYYLLDTIEIADDNERYFEETAVLLHSYTNGLNKLANDGSFNWLLLGLAVGETFTILSDENAGDYEIKEITPAFLTLQRISSGVGNQQGEYTTTFKYYISATTANYKIRTNEGFDFIDNLNGSSNYANLRFSTKRNIINYYSEYLSSCNIFSKNTPFRNTYYKNNPECRTSYQGNIIKEGEDYLPNNPILTPTLYEGITFICDFEEFKEFEYKIRTDGGYFRFLNHDGQVIKGYPINIKYSNYKREMICDLEEKYEPAYITIVKDETGYLTINNETSVYRLKWEIESNKLFIFDDNKIPLYNGVFWNKVSINGQLPESVSELKNWLKLL
jgi:hypothetical protein